MHTLLVALHGILTRQTDPSWPDRLDAWMARRDPGVKVLKKEYAAGPFPRWNCVVKNPRLARALEAEILLFVENGRFALPPTWLVAHSNGAVIALRVTQRLIARGHRVGGLILTGAACPADVRANGVWNWCQTGRLGAAIAYCSAEDRVLAGDARAPGGSGGPAAPDRAPACAPRHAGAREGRRGCCTARRFSHPALEPLPGLPLS